MKKSDIKQMDKTDLTIAITEVVADITSRGNGTITAKECKMIDWILEGLEIDADKFKNEVLK